MLHLPPVIGHRGACTYAPENTLASFAKAAELGCRMVEFDVRLSGDGIPVVFHDDTLDRCTTARGPVKDRRAAELETLGIPTLEQVLALCAARGMGVNIEIKPDVGAERATAITALELAGSVWSGPPPLVSSFAASALDAARAAAPHWPRGLLVERVPNDWRARAEALECVALHAHHRGLDAATIAAIRQAGYLVLAYTVNSPARARTLWSGGVVAVFSDAPDRVGAPGT